MRPLCMVNCGENALTTRRLSSALIKITLNLSCKLYFRELLFFSEAFYTPFIIYFRHTFSMVTFADGFFPEQHLYYAKLSG